MRCPDCRPRGSPPIFEDGCARTAGAAMASAVPQKLTGSSETLVTTLYSSLSGTEKQNRLPVRPSAALESR